MVGSPVTAKPSGFRLPHQHQRREDQSHEFNPLRIHNYELSIMNYELQTALYAQRTDDGRQHGNDDFENLFPWNLQRIIQLNN